MDLSTLVEELVFAESRAVELAEAGADLGKINQALDIVRDLHVRLHELQSRRVAAGDHAGVL